MFNRNKKDSPEVRPVRTYLEPVAENEVAPTMAHRYTIAFGPESKAHLQLSPMEREWAVAEGLGTGESPNGFDMVMALLRVGLRSVSGPDAYSSVTEETIDKIKTTRAAARAIPATSPLWSDVNVWGTEQTPAVVAYKFSEMLRYGVHEGNCYSSQPAQTSGEEETANSASDNPDASPDSAAK